MTHYPAHSRIYNIKADSLMTPKDETNKTLHNLTGNTSATLKTTVNENLASLTGLLAHYNSDSEQEETNGLEPNKLDAKVDDFLQEINQLAPTNVTEQRNKKDVTISNAWQECFDESTGYPYYWNIETNAVTWEMPQEYKDWLTHKSVINSKVSEKTAIQPEKIELPTKDLNTKQVSKEICLQQNNSKIKRKVLVKKCRRPSNDSEDEKIVMITSFSEGSGSESDNEKSSEIQTKKPVSNFFIQDQPLVVMGPHAEDIPEQVSQTLTVTANSNDMNKKEIIELVKEENIDETIILSRLRTQAKVLQELGGELPISVDKSIICSDRTDISDNIKPQSLALVAGYGDDSEPEDEPTSGSSLFPIPNEPKEINLEPHQSTLFPVTTPIDVKQFEVPINSDKPQIQNLSKDTGEKSVIDNKVFKRKKRLDIAFGVQLIKNEKRIKVEEPGLDLDFTADGRKGFGFQDDTDSNSNEEILNEKLPFKKGAIAFVKADMLSPAESILKNNVIDTEDDIEDFQEVKNVVTEKVNFLGEGKPLVSPVQIMSIQLQTLEAAYKASGLSQRYLYTWLRETFTELGKLEQEAAPEGWQCQWDRSNKRYFYRNQQTGNTQWEYPESDIVGGSEAMDICTTPPPANDEQTEIHSSDLAPSSPSAVAENHIISSPPPPAVIATVDIKDSKGTSNKENQPKPPSALILDVAPPPPPAINVSENQPLPPGVDSPDLPFSASELEESNCTEVNESTGKDALGSELDSFYSDIALLEATTLARTDILKPNTNNVPSPSPTVENVTVNDIAVKKKKKLKPKLGQGINMKKKAVSSLVEKWKKVQNDYL